MSGAEARERDVENGQVPLNDVDSRSKEAGYTPTSVKIWKLYESTADKHDTALTETWKGETDAMLIFTGLFSAVVSAFIIETYKTLQPDSSDATVVLLTQLVQQSSGTPQTTPVPVPTQKFKASATAIRINILMFLSLFLSLTCALMSTLIQQWAREYLQYSQLSAPPHKRGRVRAYLFEGLTKFQMRRMVEGIPVLLHISVFLFFFALSEFLHSVNGTVGLAARYCFIVLLAAYLALSILPLVVSSSPYQTALTAPLRPCVIFLRFIIRLPVLAMKGHHISLLSIKSNISAAIRRNRSRDLLTDTDHKAVGLDHLALQWLLNDADEDRMDKFVIGLPALIHSPFIKDPGITMGELVEDGILERIGEHFTTCASSREISEVASTSRAVACVDALHAILSVLDESANNTLHGRATNTVIRSLDMTRCSHDSALALRAACIRALTFNKFLGQLSVQGVGYLARVPEYLKPLALRLHTWASVDSRSWRDPIGLDLTEKRVVNDGFNAWSSLAYDGPLINLLVLVRDILPYSERPTLDLTMTWETLGTLVDALGVTQAAISPEARTRFEEVYADMRLYIYGSAGDVTANEGLRQNPTLPVSPGLDSSDTLGMTGSLDASPPRAPDDTTAKEEIKVQKALPVYAVDRLSQLLELMEKIARGLRLAEVLSVSSTEKSPTGMPSTAVEQRVRQDQIFAKTPFDSFEVVDAFSFRLPAFISSVGVTDARDKLERFIMEDRLLRSVDEHLKTSVKEDISDVTRQRVAMASLLLLEDIFLAMEGMMGMRWHQAGVDLILRSANKAAFSQGMVGRFAQIRAYGVLGMANHVVMGQLRARIAADRRSKSPVRDITEQVFILRVYDWLCLGDEQERKRRQGRPESHSETLREAALPRYLERLVRNGPLQNFSIMAFHIAPHLDRNEPIPDRAWEILRKLKEVPGFKDVDDSVARHYFGTVRENAHKAVTKKEGHASSDQLELLKIVNEVAGELGLPDLGPLPQLPPPPRSPSRASSHSGSTGEDDETPGSEPPVPPHVDGYSPEYIWL